MSGMLMSDERWRSCCTLSDGKHNNNKTSKRKARSKTSTRNANIHLVTKCQGCPRYDDATFYRRREPRLDVFLFFKFLS